MSSFKRTLRSGLLAVGVVLAVVLGLTGVASGAPAPAVTSENIVHVTAQNYDQVVAQSKDKLVILDFGATWCPPCQEMKPVIERLADEYGGKFLLGEVDADESKQLLDKHNVQYLPTLVGLKSSQETDRHVGFEGEQELRSWIDAQLAH